MIDSMQVNYGYINPSKGEKYVSSSTRIPVDCASYGDLMDLHILPYMIPNLDSLEEMLDKIESGHIFISWDVTGEGVFGMFRKSVIYSTTELELRIYRMFLNSL